MVKWGSISLEDACIPNGVVRGPFGGSLTKEIFVSSGYKVYEQQNAIYKSTKLGFYHITYEKYREMARFSVLPGDFIVSCSGTIGRIYRIPENAPEGIINQALLKLTIDEKKLNPTYFEKYFTWELFQNKIIDDTQGGAIKNLVGMDVFRKTLFPCPSIPEQTAIAEALSDVDELIDSLENLIEKKKAIKQGAMQELLTGRKRLPGFKGEWLEKSLGDLFYFYGGVSASRDMLSTVGYCYLHYGDIHSAKKPFIHTSEDYSLIPKFNVNLRKVPVNSLLSDGDVVFVDASEDDEGASRHIVVRNPQNLPFISGLHTIVAKEKNSDLTHLYREYCFQTKQIKDQFKHLAAGTKVTGISKGNISKIELRFPADRLEQEAIATILSDMDTEIETLTQKLEKSRQIKQGMMQELLTGRIRLLDTTTKKQKKAKATKTPKPELLPQSHNEHFHEAVILSTVVSLFASDQYPLGRFRRQKLAYLLHRHAQESTQGFLKKAAGPYNPTIRYKDESIALKANYVVERGKGKFVKGEKNSEAVEYFVQWYGTEAIEWLGQFQYRKNDDLEVLTTVAEAIEDLKRNNLAITVEAVKQVIRENPEWRPKLDKDCFSDFKIQSAIKESQKLFG